MERSELYAQSSGGKNKLTTKRKGRFLSYSKEKRAHILKNTTLDNFLVTSPVKSEESDSTSCSSHLITEVAEDKIDMEKETKSKYFTTDIDKCPKSVIINNNSVETIITESCSDVNKIKNAVVSEIKNSSSLNDSTEFFNKSKYNNRDNKRLRDNQQTGEVEVPFSAEVDSKDVFKTQTQADCTATSTTVMQSKRIQCPLCLKTVEKYVTHIKTCAAKRKLTTQQLMMALELQKKQAEERLALGLPLLPDKLPVTRKTGNNRSGPDANLDLALALSASMREAEEIEILEEADVLSQAGLKTEAAQKRSTLEGFGFASTRPRTGIIGRYRARPLVMSTLMTRTQEERERIISEKVALVLIGDDENSVTVSETVFLNSEPIVVSKKLYKQLNKELRLWKKSSSNEERNSYYVKDLDEFVTLTKADIGCNLRHLSQIAGRVNTPKRDDDVFDLQTLSSHGQKNQQQSPVGLKSSSETMTDLPAIINVTAITPSPEFSCECNQLSNSWRSMLGNRAMSNVMVQITRDNTYIPAHRLVLYVRCKEMFRNIVTVESGQQLVVLNNCGKTACIAFLEFLYCSTVNNLSELSESELSELNKLAKKYKVHDLLKFLEDNNKTVNNRRTVGSCDDITIVTSAKRRLFWKKKSDDDDDDINSASLLAENINHREGIEMSCHNDIKTTENCSPADGIYDQTTVTMVDSSEADFCHGSATEDSKPGQNIGHKNLDMLLSLLQDDDDVETSSPKRAESLLKDVTVYRAFSSTYEQRTLESSDNCLKKKHCASDVHNNVGSNDTDYIIESDDGNAAAGVDSNKVNDNAEDGGGIDEEEGKDDGGSDDVENLNNKTSYENMKDDLMYKFNDENNDYDLTQKLNVSENNYYDLTQNFDDRIDENNLRQQLNEENDEHKSVEEINNSVDDIMIVSSDSEACERNNEDYPDKDQSDESREYVSSSEVEKTNCITVNNLQDSSFGNKAQQVSPKSKCVSVLYEKDYIDPIWDGFEDLNCNINDVWQTDSPPGIRQSTDDVAIEKALSVKSSSEKNTHSNSSDLEIMSVKTETPVKTVLYDMETRSPTCIVFDKKSTETVKTLTFESFFKNKHSIQETSVDNNRTDNKLLQSNFENISPNKNINLPPLGNILGLSSPLFETLNTNKSSSGAQLSESVLTQSKIYKAGSHNLILSPKCSSSPEESSKLDSKLCSQKSVHISSSNNFQHDKSSKQSEVHEVSESSESSDCDGNEKYDSAMVFSNLGRAGSMSHAHKVHESGSQRSSIDHMKALLDDSFEISDTVLLSAEEEARISQLAQKLTKSAVTPDKLKAATPLKLAQRDQIEQISKAVTPPNLAGTISTPSSQIIVSDKPTPMPDYSSMGTPLLKKELKKFGLKQSLGRNKSVRLLQYIYDQTHPLVPAHRLQHENDNVQVTVEAKGSLHKSRNGKSPSQQPKSSRVESAVRAEIDSKSDSMLHSSECVLSSNSGSDDVNFSESCGVDDGEFDDGGTQSTTDNSAAARKLTKISYEKINEVMKQIIQNDNEFYSRLLMYESVSLLEFIDRLKTSGFRAKGSDIRRYLDSECIVYQLPKSKTQMDNKKRKRRRRPMCGSDNNRSDSNKSSPVKTTKRVK